jgi:hypothetical protein
MKLERIGEWVRHRNGWFIPLQIDIENWSGKAEGDWQVRLYGAKNASTLYYFKTESEAQEFAKEIMGGGKNATE